MNGEYIGLVGRIEQTLLDLDRVEARAQSMLAKALQSNDDGYYDAVALNLHGFYAGVERIFEDIARTFEGAVPGDADWHRKLLLQMASQADPMRPAVIAVETRRCLDEYRMFRHIVRNIYTFNLRPSRLHELTEELPDCYRALKQDLARFVNFIRDLTKNT